MRSLSRALLTLLALLTSTVLAAAALAGTAHAAPSDAELIAAAKKYAAAGVSGANDWNCKPTPQRPRPVVLVHGTGGIGWANWIYLSQAVASRGYCVFALEYGYLPGNPFPGMAHIEQSAPQLSTFVDGVLAATGADKVDLVGHSQGGMMPRYYIRFLGGAAKVDDLIGIAPSNHGTRYGTWVPEFGFNICNACEDQTPGSALLTRLNADRETEPGVDYTTIITRYDELVVPWQGQKLSGPAARLTNVVLQDACPAHLSGHALIVVNGLTLQWVDHALTRQGPADPAFRPRCLA